MVGTLGGTMIVGTGVGFDLASTGTLSAAIGSVIPKAVGLSGGGTLSAVRVATYQRTAAFVGNGGLAAPYKQVYAKQPALSGGGTFGDPNFYGTGFKPMNATGDGVLSASSVGVGFHYPALAGGGTLAAPTPLATYLCNARFGEPNLVPDPGFEATYYSTEQAHGGSRSLKLVGNGPGNYSDYNLVDLRPTQPGRQFLVESWVYAPVSNVGTHVMNYAAFTDSMSVNPVTFANPGEAYLTKGLWTKLSGYCTVPAGYDQVMFRASVRDDNQVGDVFYWDDALVQEAAGLSEAHKQVYPSAPALSGSGTLSATRSFSVNFTPTSEENTARSNAGIPPGASQVRVTLIGSGGGGGMGSANTNGNVPGGAGGGGGAYVKTGWIPVSSLGSTYSVTRPTVGGTGSGTSASGGTGANAVFSSGGIVITAGGGAGGQSMSTSNTRPVGGTVSGAPGGSTTESGASGGTSGTNTTGNFPGSNSASAGAGGGAGAYQPTVTTATGGKGGNSTNGTGGSGSTYNSNQPGQPGSSPFPGAGGSGGGGSGGSGASGGAQKAGGAGLGYGAGGGGVGGAYYSQSVKGGNGGPAYSLLEWQ